MKQVIKLMLVLLYINLTYSETNGPVKSLRIPLFRKKSPRHQMALVNNDENSGFEFVKNDSIALLRYLDSEFYGKVVVGSPGKTFEIIFATTWSPSWLLSSECNGFGCWHHKKYDHDKSSTYKPDNRKFNMDEGTYNLTGFFSYETFSVGHLRVNQTFIEITNINPTFILDKADGLFGLGQKFGNYTPFIYKLLEYGNITDPLFCVYLNRDRHSPRGGDIIMGFIETKHIHVTKKKFDNITYLPLTSSIYWQFKIDKIMLVKGKNKSNLCINGCDGIIDTTNNIIVGPKKDISVINKMIKAIPIPFFGRFRVQCEPEVIYPAVRFILNGIPFVLKSDAYIQKMSWGPFTFCLSAFTYSDNPAEQDNWVLGGAFLAEYYSIYDLAKRRIGFVKAA